MDKDTENRIVAIETTVAEIDATIARLQQEREAAMLSDEEYASYVEHYRAFYADEPLPIREYYTKMAEIEQINSEFDKAKKVEDFEALWHKYAKRLDELERALAA
jgi:predicted RNase H-like nuclease (RuvC/YqgF family)